MKSAPQNEYVTVNLKIKSLVLVYLQGIWEMYRIFPNGYNSVCRLLANQKNYTLKNTSKLLNNLLAKLQVQKNVVEIFLMDIYTHSICMRVEGQKNKF